MKNLLYITALFFGLTFANQSYGQVAICDSIVSLCGQHMSGEYISDGQVYNALLNNDEVAEFHTTFFGGSTYRIAAQSGFTDGNLIFTVRDSERNLLFSSDDFSNAPYWDFQVNSTVDCIIEAKLNPEVSSGCAVLLIGFKQ